MKQFILTAAVALCMCLHGFSQQAWYEYRGRPTPSVKQEMLPAAERLSDLVPGLWHSLIVPYPERLELDRRSSVSYAQGFDYTKGYYIYPGEYNYSNNVEYISVDLSATSKGKILKARGTGDQLSAQQKSILAAADPNTEIRIRIRFRYKPQADEVPGAADKIIEGTLAVAVVPETEAEYPGGYKQFSAYIREHVYDKIPVALRSKKDLNVTVTFTISEQGQVVGAWITNTSGDAGTDKLLLDAISHMPAWKPAQNPKGTRVKQVFSIPFGRGGC